MKGGEVMNDFPPLKYNETRKRLEAKLNNKKIRRILIWQSGRVSVSTTDKSQLPECNGCILDPKVIENISKQTSEITEVYFGDMDMTKTIKMDLSWWFRQERQRVIKKERRKP
jgi:hypothetical protein